MTPVLAHFTGIPHGDAAEMSIIGLWPILLAIVEVLWLLATRRARGLLRDACRVARGLSLPAFIWATFVTILFLTVNHLR